MALLAFTLGWLLLLFVIARAAESRPAWTRLSEHPLIYAMSLGVYATSWTFFGAVGFARTHGVTFIAVCLGPTLACLLVPSVFLPLLRLVRRHQLATVADLFAFRYRSQPLGAAVTLAMLLGVLPYLAVQVRAVGTTAAALVPGLDPALTGLAFCGVMLLFTTLFGARHATTRERHPGLVMAIAFESAFKTLALLAVGLVAATLDVHPDPARVEAFLEPARSGGSGFTSVLLLSTVAAFLLPRQFQMAFTEAPTGAQGERALRTASWAFPLLLLAMNLPIPFVLWAGEALEPAANGDLYVLLVAERVPWLAPVVWLGGVSASSAMVIVSSLALSSMTLTHLVGPLLGQPAGDVYDAIVRRRRVVVAVLLAATFGVFLTLQTTGASRGGALAQVGLVSFAAVLQVLPGVVGVFFLPRLSARGVLAGLVAGMVTWGLVLALPVVGIGGVSLPAWLTGDDALGVGALVSVAVNVGVATLVAAMSAPTPLELRAGRVCRDEVDSLAPGRLPLSLEGFVERVAPVLGRDAAKAEVARVAASLGLGPEERSAAALQRVGEQLESNLTGLLGPVLAHAALTTEGDDDPTSLPLATRLQLLEEEARRGGAAASQALRTWLTNVFASLPVGVCVVGADEQPVWWNAAWPGLAGATSAEAIRALTPDGERTVGKKTLMVTSAAVPGDGVLPGGRVVVLEDFTTRRSLEQTVAHQERLASIGRLGAGVAHEIGNPLAGLLMVAHNLELEDSPTDLKERLGAIVQQGRRIDEIVKALVTFARVERPEQRTARPVAIDHVAKEAVALVTMTRRRRIEIAIEPQLTVTGVEGELMQVLVNLLSNAADASPEDSAVLVTGQRVGEEVELTVSDTGVGMPAEVQARLFEPFFSTKDPGKGTGLGMSIVYSLVRAHGGRVTVESAVGRGTTVLLRFPVGL
jgi:signal transduction histidine kinase